MGLGRAWAIARGKRAGYHKKSARVLLGLACACPARSGHVACILACRMCAVQGLGYLSGRMLRP
eukprot:8603898-Lingulodinium_polyedra.AAC.1